MTDLVCMKKTILILSMLFLAACQNPQNAFEDVVLENGYIPFLTPMSDTNVGTVIKGNANTLITSIPSYRCFPKMIGDYETGLVHLNRTDLPDKYKEFTIDFGSDISALSGNGNPTFEFNANFKRAKSISIKFEGAQIESLDELSFESFYKEQIPESCKKALLHSAFIVGALKVEKMNFTFKDEYGADISLDINNLDEIVKFHSGVKFSIKNNFTLVVDTPKYIGYRLAKINSQENGLIEMYATRFDENAEFIFTRLKTALLSLGQVH